MTDRMTALANLAAKWLANAATCRADAERLGEGNPVHNELLRDAAQYEQCAHALQMTIATLSPAELGGVEEPVAWWNGQRPTSDGLCYPSITWDGEDTHHDVPLYSHPNPASTPRADEAAVDDAMVERLAKYIYQQEAWKAGFSLDESLRHQAYWARAIPEARKMLTAALSPPSPGAAK